MKLIGHVYAQHIFLHHVLFLLDYRMVYDSHSCKNGTVSSISGIISFYGAL
jgi:hypothetical protein